VAATIRNSSISPTLANLEVAYSTTYPFALLLIGLLMINLLSLRGHYFSEGARGGEVTVLKYILLFLVVTWVGHQWVQFYTSEHSKSLYDKSYWNLSGTKNAVIIYGVCTISILAKWLYNKANEIDTTKYTIALMLSSFWLFVKLVPFTYYSLRWLLEAVASKGW
jgi:hypothetical protein